MIVSFGSKDTEKIWNGERVENFPIDIQQVGRQKLRMLNNSQNVGETRVSQIIKGRRRITADTALRLSYYFGNFAKFWLGLQDDFDLEEGTMVNNDSLKRIAGIRKNVQ